MATIKQLAARAELIRLKATRIADDLHTLSFVPEGGNEQIQILLLQKLLVLEQGVTDLRQAMEQQNALAEV